MDTKVFLSLRRTVCLRRYCCGSRFTSYLSQKVPECPLHGGPIGFDSLPWTLLSADTPPTLFSKAELGHFPGDENGSHAIFRLVSPSGDQGYPGELTIEVLISLLAPVPQVMEAGKEFDLGSLVYVYRAKVNKGVTPVNLTQVSDSNVVQSIYLRSIALGIQP